MKIGILSSGNDMLVLFKILQNYDHEYVIFYDQFFGMWGDQSFDAVVVRIEKGIKFLSTQGIKKIIVPPLVELYFVQEKKYQSILFPIFHSYITHCFSYSLIGKIGILADYMDMSHAQEIFTKFAKSHILTEKQKTTKKFHFPFVYWIKAFPMWKYFFRHFSWSNVVINKIIKHDLRYFKDANVDTLIPLNYSYFNAQKTIRTFFNTKKTKFHSLTVLSDLFFALNINHNCDKYSVQIFYNGHINFLKQEKRLLWLLQRGRTIDLVMTKIDL